MILTLRKKIKTIFLVIAFIVSFTPFCVNAQGALTLSVSPTLFEMSASPGQEWTSTVKVINANPFDINVYVDKLNFAPQGEAGHGKFLPVFEKETGGDTLAEWISVDDEGLVIPAEQTIRIPFTIRVPHDSPPGGHSAAILIGTKSLSDEPGQTQVETSQVVSSLIFLRVAGEVIEDGSIRDFYTTRTISEKPDVTFEMRFENKGNVHIRPQGDIKIINMWGQERGVIPVNRQTMFGNVLPESIRKYRFTWEGQWSLADMGRYTAIATLAYGENERKFTTSETYFWVIPWKILLTILAVLIGFFALVTWAIKLYVRKMLSMAGVSPELQAKKSRSRNIPRISVVAPIEEGILDLRSRLSTSDGFFQKLITYLHIVKHYKVFFFVTAAIVIFIITSILYVRSASVSERGYQITIDGLDSNITISSEEVEYDALKEQSGINQIDAVKEFPQIKVVNRSGFNGLAASLRLQLEQMGYVISELSNDIDLVEDKTVIVYNPDFTEEAFRLSQDIHGSLLSAFTGSETETNPITVYVGKEYENAVQLD